MLEKKRGSIVLVHPWVWLLIIVAIGFALRLVVYGFIKLPWILFDEVVYLDTAREVVRGSFISHIERDQLYPAGWPLVISGLVGFIKNPFVQYKAALLLTMLISSLVPVLVYFLLGNLWVSALVTLYPPLFVYSSSIMSETFYTVVLLLLTLSLQEIMRDDIKKQRLCIALCGVVFGFLIYFARITRSFGVVILPSFAAASLVFWYFTHQFKIVSRHVIKNIFFLVVTTVIAYIVFAVALRGIFFPQGGLYESSPYIDSLRRGLTSLPLLSRVIHHELTAVFVWLLWILPIFFIGGTVHALKKHNITDFMMRLFIGVVFIFSFLLAILHMLRRAHFDQQYLLFMRYLDPIMVLLFAYGVFDFLRFLKNRGREWHINWLFFLAPLYFFIYLKLYFYRGSYKFGNNMALYFLSKVENFNLLYLGITLALLIVAIFIYQKRYRLAWLVFVAWFVMQSAVAIITTPGVPRHVQKKYSTVIGQWGVSFQGKPTDIPLCIYGGHVTVEVFYMYHFLYPYQYLQSCQNMNQQRPRRVIIGNKFEGVVPPAESCEADYRFGSGESIYYCPLGY